MRHTYVTTAMSLNHLLKHTLLRLKALLECTVLTVVGATYFCVVLSTQNKTVFKNVQKRTKQRSWKTQKK
jgi:hypothetical protein